MARNDSSLPLKEAVSYQVDLFAKELRGADQELQKFWAAQPTTFDHFALQTKQDFFFMGAESVPDAVNMIKTQFRESDLVQQNVNARKILATKKGSVASEFFEYDKGRGNTGMGHIFWARLGAQKGCDICLLYLVAECDFTLMGSVGDTFLGKALPAEIQEGIRNCMRLQYVVAACEQKLVMHNVMQGISSRSIGLLRDASFMNHVRDNKVEVVVSAPQCMNRFREIYIDMCKRYMQGKFRGVTSEEQEALKAVWDMWAMPYNGLIGPKELLQILYALDQPPENDGDDLIATFREWDLDGDGNISFKEFITEMQQRVKDGITYYQ